MPTSPPTAVRIICAEHAALKAVLLRIQIMLLQHARAATMPDFADLRAMLFYIDEFPERLHHRKETDLLFPKLRSRVPALRHVLDRLDNDHTRGEHNIREVQHALLAFELLGSSRRAPFERAMARYADFYIDHMETEEQHILPVAEKLLTAEDWLELEEAFSANGDMLAGDEPTAEYRSLFCRIFDVLPGDYLVGDIQRPGNAAIAGRPTLAASTVDGPAEQGEPHDNP